MKIIAPTSCPSCGSVLERVNDQLFCRNSADCPAQCTKKLQNFCKKLKIKGFGEITLDKLNLVSYNDLITLTVEDAVDGGFSEHMAKKLVETVKSSLDLGISPNDFLAAVSIPLIGDGVMRKLVFDKLELITYNLCIKQGIGDKAAKSLMEWLDNEWYKYQDLWEPHFIIKKSQTPSTVQHQGVVCITGKLDNFKSRTDAASFLASKGYEVKSSVTKAVQYLICEDGTTGSSYKKAITNGIPVTTIKELLED